MQPFFHIIQQLKNFQGYERRGKIRTTALEMTQTIELFKILS